MFLLSEVVQNIYGSVKWVFVVTRVHYKVGHYTIIEQVILENQGVNLVKKNNPLKHFLIYCTDVLLSCG